ncbi:MAG TPA: LytTR family DNA-binding domain-containing protein [Chitinophagaceae bacterium]|nr:LytTR family DNA-binding domain-containing protein [Chitinophagaceae bacterium]
MPVTCIAVDDEPPALEVLKAYVQKLPALRLLQTFDDAVTAGEFLRSHPVELLFVDINMPDINGLQLVKSLATKPGIIFTTAYKNFAHEGFELDAIDYLLKPISFERFQKAVQKASEYFQYRQKSGAAENLFVYAEYRMIKIPVSEIEYIESLEDYIRIHRTGTSPVMTLMTLKGVLEKLPSPQFQRIHRSYIVAADRVISIQNRKARLQSGMELPISDSYTGFIQQWKNRG